MKRSPVRRVRINSIAIGPPNAVIVVPVYRPRSEIEIRHFSPSVYDITENLWWLARPIFSSIHSGPKAPVLSRDEGFVGMADVAMDGSGYITARRTKYQISREAYCRQSPSSMFWPLLQFIGRESAEKSLRVSARQAVRSVAPPRFPAADSAA